MLPIKMHTYGITTSYHSSWWQEMELKKANEGERDLNYILELLPVYLCKFVYMLISYESAEFISK